MAHRRLFTLIGALLLVCAVLRSEIIYTSFVVPGPDGSGGGFLLGPKGHPPMPGFFSVAVPFVPNGDYTLDSIRIPITAYIPAPLDQFTIELREGDVEPGAVVERYSVNLSGFSVVNLRSARHPLLETGKQYWVVVSTAGGGEWGWGGVIHPRGKVFYQGTTYRPWKEVTDYPYIPGLQVSGTPAPITSSPIQFGNGGSIPHIVAGGGWQTTLILVNTARRPLEAQLSFWDGTGGPLLLPLVDEKSGLSRTAASVVETIPPGGTVTVTASDSGALKQGSAILSTSEGVGALAVIRYNPSGQETGLTIENRNANSYVLSFDDTGGNRMGIAVANLSAIPVNVPVVIRDENGAVLERATVSLFARGHTAFDLADKYAQTKDRRGSIELATPEFARISVIGLRFAPTGSGNSSLTAIPVLAK